MFEDSPSNFLYHTSCESCGSSDANAVYDNNTSHCFSCGKNIDDLEIKEAKPVIKKDNNLLDVQYVALTRRGITLETARHWGYGVSEYKGEKVQVANYYNEQGEVINQKIRFKNKNFISLGNTKHDMFYGQNLCRDEGRIVITEGELDALSLSQCIGLKWNVVSLPNGVSSVKKVFSKNIEWLNNFKEIILMFDNDKVGIEAAKLAASLLPPNKAKIASLPLKDANEMLVAGRIKELVDAYWGAKPYRPDGIINGNELWEEIIKEDDLETTPYPYQSLNIMLGGFHIPSIVTLVAGSGMGKSQLARELANQWIQSAIPTGYIALEESTKRTALGMMSLIANKPLHISRNKVGEKELRTYYEATVGNGNVYLYDHFGSTDTLLSKIRYLAIGCGCKHIVLDHISIVVSGMEEGDERRLIDNLMTKLRSLVEELKVGLILVSHLKRPSGDKGHEDGAQTSLAQLRGSASIAQLSDTVIGLERNQQDVNNKNISQIRILKNRWSGETGSCCLLEYIPETGRMIEIEDFPIEEEETTDF